jgi:hypothetical protein
MTTLIALCFVLAASSAFAAGHSGPIAVSPLDRPVPGLRDPLDVRDPLMQPPSYSAPLPDLGSSGTSDQFGNLQPHSLPGTQSPLVVEPYAALPEPRGMRHYWQNDPLFVSPAP